MNNYQTRLRTQLENNQIFLPPAYVVRREGTVFTGVYLSTHRGVPSLWSQVPSLISGSKSLSRGWILHGLWSQVPFLVPGPLGGYPMVLLLVACPKSCLPRGRHHQKSIKGVSVASQKGLMFSKFFLKR